MKLKKTWVNIGICFVICMGAIAFILMRNPIIFASEKAVESQVVKVAVIDYPNFLQMNTDGSISGYAYEYLLKIQRYTDWNYEFDEMSFSDASNALKNGQVDLLVGNQYIQSREEYFDYSKRSMGEGGTVLCVRADDTKYCYNDYSSYDGMRIAVLRGSARIEQTQNLLEEYGASAQYIEFDTDEESKAALDNGNVDAILMSTIRCENKYKILARINSTPLYFCTNKQRPQLKEELDQAMDKIYLDDPYYALTLHNKYYGSIAIQLTFTQEELEYIAKSKNIAVAVSDDLVPLEYYSKEDNDYMGFVPDMFRLMEEYSGLKFEFVKRPGQDSLSSQLSSGSIQMIGIVENTSFAGIQSDLTLSDSFLKNSVSIVINNNGKDYDNHDSTIVLNSGHPYLKALAESEGYHNIIYADSFEDCIDMVAKNKADGTLVNTNYADCMTHKSSYNNLSSSLLAGSDMYFSIGISKDEDPILVSIINKSIAHITNEQKSELLTQNLSKVNSSYAFRNFIAANGVKILWLIIGIAILIIALTFRLSATRKRTNRQLEIALRNADAANRAKTDFLARMSHDMRTPMNGILGLSYLMEDEIQSVKVKKQLMQLRDSGKYLLQLINDVLDINKVESGNLKIVLGACDEEHVFTSILDMIRPEIERKSIQFNFNKTNILWTRVIMDEQRVKQIFINLLTNAIKFTPQGGTVDFIMEIVSQNEERIQYRFVVRDTGIGMSEEFIPRVFVPFEQENRTDAENEGTGLGLSIVKHLVELMDGSITVQSKVNEGTEFEVYLTFPLAPYEEPKSIETDEKTTFPQHCKILLCEDQPINAQIAIWMLEKKELLLSGKRMERMV